MKTKWIEREFKYDGEQLHSLFAYMQHGVQGDSVVSWVGPCAVTIEHMVDGEDLLAGATIAGDKMVHFIVEKFHTELFAAVAVQRLMAAICLDYLKKYATRPGISPAELATRLRREGDDLYFDDGKLSISIATVSPVSSLIHFAVNCINDGTPVKTAALNDLGIKPKAFAEDIMTLLSQEIVSIEEATVKVRWVK